MQSTKLRIFKMLTEIKIRNLIDEIGKKSCQLDPVPTILLVYAPLTCKHSKTLIEGLAQLFELTGSATILVSGSLYNL